MFENALTVGKARSRGRSSVSLSLALGAQASLLAGFTLAFLFSNETLPPPALMVAGLPEVPVRLTFVGPPRGAGKPVQAPGGPTLPPRDDRLQAPAEPPSRIPAPSDAPAAPRDAPGPAPPAGWIDDGTGGGDRGLIVPPARRVIAPGYTMLQIPRLLSRVDPVYPAAAVAMGLQGRVVLQIVVDESGAVEDVQVLSASNPLFVPSAVEAVRRWRYTRPLDQKGQTAACYLTVTVSFVTR